MRQRAVQADDEPLLERPKRLEMHQQCQKQGYGNCRAMETVEKQNCFFPPFPQRLENSTKNVEFPTVPTAPTTGDINENKVQTKTKKRTADCLDIPRNLRGLEPGPINTFPGWQALGRAVKRGERALTLCMPITRKVRDEESHDSESENHERTFTSFVYKPRWFVVSQTVGDEFVPPGLPEWNADQALAALDIEQITFTHTDGNCQGYAQQRQIAINPVAQLPHKTLFHEVAHVVLAHTSESDFADTERTPKNLREVEAEAVALLCCEALNLEGATYCRGYIQNWLYPAVGYNGAGIPEKSAQKILHGADQILRAGRLPANENADKKHQNQMGQTSAFALV